MIKKYRTVLSYILSSGSSFIIDILLFTILMFFIKNIIISSYLARAISSIINYLLNKYLVFKSKENKTKTLFGYFALVVINITISGVLVSLINSKTGINASIIKIVIDSLIFISNYFIQKYIIFESNNHPKLYKYTMPLLSFIALFMHINKNGLLFNYNLIDIVVMLVSIFILYFMFLKLFKYNNKHFSILSLIFSIFMIIGYSYAKSYTYNLIFGNEILILLNLIRVIGFYHLFKNILNYVYETMKTVNLKDIKDDTKSLFSKHPFLFSFIVLLLFYSIYLISFYPGVLNYDNANQIKEVLGEHTRYLDSIIVINKNITLTNFNPIVHTLLLGNLYKIGSIINGNFGVFLYTFIQFIVVISVLSYSISFLYKEKIKVKYLFILLIIYMVIPYYPFYSITCVKDTYWTAFYLLYIIYLYKYLKYQYTIKDYLKLIGIIILLILFRNNGIVPVLFSLPIIILFKKNYTKPVVLLTIFTILFTIGYSNSLKLFEIPNTSPREALSVPFQQTARYVKDYPDDVSSYEYSVIDNIIHYDTLAKRYVPRLSDKVKNEYNIYTTKEDLTNYFKVWVRMGLRHPDAYINATLSNNYSYIYPDSYSWYFYSNIHKSIAKDVPGYHFNKLILPRLFLMGEGSVFIKVPILSLFASCGFWTWFYIFLLCVIIKEKKRDLSLLIIPMYSLIFMCLIGPANTYFRYVYPYASIAPVILLLVMKNINKNITY